MNGNPNKDPKSELKRIFNEDGPRAAIVFLNSLAGSRFTSLYRFDGERLRKIIFFDREYPEMDTCEDIPVMASYCVFVRDTGAMFKTVDAKHDARVQNHPKQNTIQSYCGVPLLDREGKMFGSACHFDFKSGGISDMDVELLEQLGYLLMDQVPSR